MRNWENWNDSVIKVQRDLELTSVAITFSNRFFGKVKL